MLATLTEDYFSDDGSIFERKLDGERVLAAPRHCGVTPARAPETAALERRAHPEGHTRNPGSRVELRTLVLCQPRYRGSRVGKDPGDVVREAPRRVP